MVYKFPLYVPGAAFAVALVAALVAVLLFWKRKAVAVAFMASGVAVFSGVLLGPMLSLDRVVLDDEKLEQTTGFWFAPTVKGFRLAEAASVQLSTARDHRDRAYEVWIVTMKNGKTRQFNPGDLWENNGPDILERLRARGIEVSR